jgi:predicted  nucleic acid-binding Zn-ribbon protein
MKAKVLLKDGFRFYKIDNTVTDVKAGDVFEAGDMIERDRTARIGEKHMEYVDEKTPISISPVVAADPNSPAGNAGLASKAQQAQNVRDAEAKQKADDAAAEKVLADAQAKAAAETAKTTTKQK